MRIGHGFDAHRFSTEGDLILGGLTLNTANKLLAHSDGDVLIHAVCDALLGAAGLGDIGKHFPDTDEKYKNADSRGLLRQVMNKIHDKGYEIGNLDVSVIAQTPRLAEHINAMENIIATDTSASAEQINIKATTTEKMGDIGREEGIAVHAVVVLLA